MEFNIFATETEIDTPIFSRPRNALQQSQILSFSRPDISNLNPLSNGGFRSESGAMQMGVFTHSQWMELEHQALIYKYLTAKEPVPLNLLLPIKKSLESSCLSYLPSLAQPCTYGFSLNYGRNADPEPGRCRRTDGKKWRCSRDAMAEQKYCERHLNRGRHRSRKPVEEQPVARGVGSRSSRSRKDATWHDGSGEYVWGPLGEVMKSGGGCKGLAPLNLIGEGWDSSPAAVVAKVNFNSHPK